MIKQVGLLTGPVVALLAWNFNPFAISESAAAVAAVMTWMAIWWVTAPVSVAVTALLPLVFFPVLGVSDMRQTAVSYAHPIVFLFFGGFVMALALENSGLPKRDALILLKSTGVHARSIVGGLILIAAVLSMWISNTSAALLILPVALSIVAVVKDSSPDLSPKNLSNFEVSALLGVAYGATMGGLATLIGTPPNAFLAGFMETTYNVEIGFAQWMFVGLPISLVMLPIVWFVLTHLLYSVNFRASSNAAALIGSLYDKLGPMSVVEKRTGALFFMLVIGWLFRSSFSHWLGWQNLTDAGIAVGIAVLAFVIPRGDGSPLIKWSDTKRMPWEVLILFGGGLALAAAMGESGLTVLIGQQLVSLTDAHIAVLILASCVLVIFLTELTSNLATTAAFLPVVAALAVETGSNPMIFVVPVALAASCAFMLPVATPPNAVAFSTGRVPISKMMRSGLILNLVAVVILSFFGLYLVPLFFD